jgi:hypothetical protein
MAASDAKATAYFGVAHRLYYSIIGANGQPLTGAAGLDSEVSKDGGTFADCTNEATEIAVASGIYFLDLTATEMEADTVVIQTKSTVGITRVITLYTETGVRTRKAQAGAAGTITLDASASATDDFYLDQLVAIVGGTGVGQVRLISDYVGSTKVASVVPNWVTNPDATSIFHLIRAGRVDIAQWLNVTPNALITGRVDVSVGEMQAAVVTATAIAAAAITAAKFASGAIDAAAIGTGAIDADAIAAAAITAAKFAAGAIDAAAIATDAIDADALAASAIAEIQAGLATAAAVAGVQADTDDLQTRLPVTLSGGKMRSQVEGLDADVITAASIAAAAIGVSEAPALDVAVSSRAAPGEAMTLTAGERDAVASVLLDLANGVEVGYTLRQTLRLMAAAVAGKASGGPGGTVFRNLPDSADRITSVADASGNRTTVTHSP